MLPLDLYSKLSEAEPWVIKYFSIIYDEFKNSEFTANQIEETLKQKGFTIENVYKILSKLEALGIIESRPSRKDMRVKLYRIVYSTNSNKSVPTKDELLKLLKSAADHIRTSVDYNVIILFLFYKAISDKWSIEVERLEKMEGIGKEDAYVLANSKILPLYDENKNKLFTWEEVVRKSDPIPAIEDALIEISKMSTSYKTSIKLPELESLVRTLGLSRLAQGDKRVILTDLIEMFNKYDFSEVSYDVLGDAYQWILRYFAPTKAKEGEVFTPREVIKLMVKLLDIEDKSVVLDPACGSAAMLVEAYNYVKEKLNRKDPYLKLYGQEVNGIMVAVSKMNLILNGITSDSYIYEGDSLVNPRFSKDIETYGGADYVIANVPWDQKGYNEEKLRGLELGRKIYKYGYPPSNNADWAWVQLMLYFSKRKIAVILDQGALFRKGSEKDIRSKIVNDDLIEAVILLPEKLFYNTGASGIILIMNKEKPSDKKDKILFINASKEYIRHPEVRRLNMLSEENIERIVNAYRKFTDIKGFSKVVSLEEVRANEYNLNVTLYVTQLDESEEIDVSKEFAELKQLEEERAKLMTIVENYISQINRALQKG